MGAYAPTSLVTPELSEKIYEKVILKTVAGLQNISQSYRGLIYPGIMVVNGEPFVLEYNIRFGDPETQPVLSLLESDFYQILNKTIDGTLKPDDVKWKNGYAVCVVLASQGYPGKYEKGKEIKGFDDVKRLNDVFVYHAGTKFENGRYYTNGGRVLGVTGLGKTITEAQNRAYEAINHISFDGMYFRKDIGNRELTRVTA
jgi:phosphoribosylamine--glycine ligase